MIKKILFTTFTLLLCACVEFKISDEEAKEALSNAASPIYFGNLPVEARNIHYAYTNNAKENLIVFIHGSPGSWNAFIDYFRADSILSKADILSIDRPGFGSSDFGNAEPCLENQAKYLKAVTDQFHHKKKILIGHSLGGPIVARMVMDNPSSYDRLILVAPSIDPEMEKEEWYRRVISTKVGAALTPKEFEVSNDEIVPLKEELAIMLPLWKRICIPVIVIQGTKDSLVPKENADFAEIMLPDTLLKVVRLEDVDHFIPWSHPEEIIKAIQDSF